MTKMEALNILSRISDIWPMFELTDSRTDEWVDCLVNADYADVQELLTQLRTSEKYPPGLADLVDDDQQSGGRVQLEQADDHWAQAMKAKW